MQVVFLPTLTPRNMRTFLATTLFLFLLVPRLSEAKDLPPPAELRGVLERIKSAVAKNEKSCRRRDSHAAFGAVPRKVP